MGMRIAALRRSSPDDSPNISTLITAEMPIIVVEIALAAICSFTLIGPLGLAWWAPVIFLAVAAAIFYAVTKLSHGKQEGFWAGLGVMRGLRSRWLIIGLVCSPPADRWCATGSCSRASASTSRSSTRWRC